MAARLQPITRSLVLSILHDPEDSQYEGHAKTSSQKGGINSPCQQHFALDPGGADKDPTNIDIQVQQVQSWLEDISKEQKQITDRLRDSDHIFQYLKNVPDGPKLPTFAGQQDIEIHREVFVGPPGLGMDTAILKRIKRGWGPRPKDIADLLSPLRSKPVKRVVEKGDLTFVSQSYSEMLNELHLWNAHIAGMSHTGRERNGIFEALTRRMEHITAIENGQEDERSFNSIERLSRSLLAFRPEIRFFKEQGHIAILIIIMANVRVASPDVDDEVKTLMMKLLLMEMGLYLRSDAHFKAEKHELNVKIAMAQQEHDSEEMQRLFNEKHKLNKRNFIECARKVIDAIKLARNNLHGHVLDQMGQLAALQAGQKWAFSNALVAETEYMWQQCNEADTKLKQTLQEEMSSAEMEQLISEAKHGDMIEMARRARHVAQKVNAEDIKDVQERVRVRKERMNDSTTVKMMVGVSEENRRARETANFVWQRMTKLEASLGAILDAASHKYREYDAWVHQLGVVGEGESQAEEIQEDGS